MLRVRWKRGGGGSKLRWSPRAIFTQNVDNLLMSSNIKRRLTFARRVIIERDGQFQLRLVDYFFIVVFVGVAIAIAIVLRFTCTHNNNNNIRRFKLLSSSFGNCRDNCVHIDYNGNRTRAADRCNRRNVMHGSHCRPRRRCI